MVKEEYHTIWMCPYCGEEYDDEDNAKDCAKECIDIESPEEKEVGKFTCEYCNNEYVDECDAYGCEEIHIENEDIYYNNYEITHSYDRLKEAAEHPAQTKL